VYQKEERYCESGKQRRSRTAGYPRGCTVHLKGRIQGGVNHGEGLTEHYRVPLFRGAFGLPIMGKKAKKAKGREKTITRSTGSLVDGYRCPKCSLVIWRNREDLIQHMKDFHGTRITVKEAEACFNQERGLTRRCPRCGNLTLFPGYCIQCSLEILEPPEEEEEEKPTKKKIRRRRRRRTYAVLTEDDISAIF